MVKCPRGLALIRKLYGLKDRILGLGLFTCERNHQTWTFSLWVHYLLWGEREIWGGKTGKCHLLVEISSNYFHIYHRFMRWVLLGCSYPALQIPRYPSHRPRLRPACPRFHFPSPRVQLKLKIFIEYQGSNQNACNGDWISKEILNCSQTKKRKKYANFERIKFKKKKILQI